MKQETEKRLIQGSGGGQNNMVDLSLKEKMINLII
jgi:hypothetical protein